MMIRFVASVARFSIYTHLLLLIKCLIDHTLVQHLALHQFWLFWDISQLIGNEMFFADRIVGNGVVFF